MKCKENLESYIKERYSLAVGERTLERLRRVVNEILDSKIKISGRSYRSGRRKTLQIPVRVLLKKEP